MAQLNEIFGNMAFLGLFILAGLGFVVVTQANNDAVQPLSDDALFNTYYGNLSDNLEGLETIGTTQYGQFTEEVPEPGFGSILLFGIVAVGKTFSNTTLSLFTFIVTLPLHVLGLPVTLISTLVTYLIIGIIIAGWSLYKLGG